MTDSKAPDSDGGGPTKSTVSGKRKATRGSPHLFVEYSDQQLLAIRYARTFGMKQDRAGAAASRQDAARVTQPLVEPPSDPLPHLDLRGESALPVPAAAVDTGSAALAEDDDGASASEVTDPKLGPIDDADGVESTDPKLELLESEVTDPGLPSQGVGTAPRNHVDSESDDEATDPNIMGPDESTDPNVVGDADITDGSIENVRKGSHLKLVQPEEDADEESSVAQPDTAEEESEEEDIDEEDEDEAAILDEGPLLEAGEVDEVDDDVADDLVDEGGGIRFGRIIAIVGLIAAVAVASVVGLPEILGFSDKAGKALEVVDLEQLRMMNNKVGALHVHSDRRATVYLNGERLGNTPLDRQEVRAGRMRIRVVDVSTAAVLEQDVTVRMGKEATVSFRFDKNADEKSSAP